MTHDARTYPIGQDYVRADWPDLRDYVYQPTLSVLRNRTDLGSHVIDSPIDSGYPRAPGFGVRQQGQSGRCAGFALAALIDLQRRVQISSHVQSRQPGELDNTAVVSADMLYRMASFHDQYPDFGAGMEGVLDQLSGRIEGVRSLRSVIKGFYHHGVCQDLPPDARPQSPEEHWQSDCYADPQQGKRPAQYFPTVAQAKAARAIGLGAYYRLRSVLNHYHAALNEAGGVLISANIHQGWHAPFEQANRGIIPPPEPVSEIGTHAVALIGYTSEGFLVLNSWGSKWGGFDGIAGVALWSYGDWARNVVDGWVLRLGVSAPSAFDASIGEQGLNRIYGGVKAASTPCYELVGHYMHLDDGFHVEVGSYPSFDENWRTTCDYLKTVLPATPRDLAAPIVKGKPERDRHGVLVWLPGSMEGINPAFHAAAMRKNAIRELGLYPYTIFWCNSFVEKSLEVLTSIFASCRRQTGDRGAHLDSLIETEMRGIGRAFWRDIEQGARRAVHGTPELPEEPTDVPQDPGVLAAFFGDLFELAADRGMELHLVAEGAGALVLHEVLRYFHSKQLPSDARPADFVTTLSLVHPAIALPRARCHITKLIAEINGRVPRPGSIDVPAYDRRHRRPCDPHVACDVLPARIYVPGAELAERLCFGDYGGSIMKLVARSFEDRLATPLSIAQAGRKIAQTDPRHPPRPFLGMAAAREDLLAQEGPTMANAFSALHELSDRRYETGRIPQSALIEDPAIEAEIFRSIRLLCKRPDRYAPGQSQGDRL